MRNDSTSCFGSHVLLGSPKKQNNEDLCTNENEQNETVVGAVTSVIERKESVKTMFEAVVMRSV